MNIENLFVAGSGLMGSGIAQICAQARYSVVLYDVSDAALTKAMETIRWSVGKFVEKGKVKGSVDDIMGRIKTTTAISDAKSVDYVFEAVFENMEIKRDVFSKLDEICPAHTILATNSSAIPTTEIASATKRMDRVVGAHFFSPVPMMKAVEVIKGMSTSVETMETTKALCRSIGKEPITVNKDVAGFLLNRINIPSNLEAIRMVEQGVGTIEEIDKGIRFAFGRAMGPFETHDLAGLDVALNAATNLYNDTKDIKFYPPMLLKRKVKAGHLGRKTGIGWYKYDDKGNRVGPAE